MHGTPQPMFPTESSWTKPSELPNLEGAARIGLDTETRDPQLKDKGPGVRRDGYMVGISVATSEGKKWYIPFDHATGDNFDKEIVIRWAKDNLTRPNQPKVGANLLYDLDYLAEAGVDVAGPFYDVQVAEPLIDENKMTYSLDSLAQQYLGETKNEALMQQACHDFKYKGKPQAHLWKLDPKYVGPYAEDDAWQALQIFEKQEKVLAEQQLEKVFDLETRLIPMLLHMRRNGVPVDTDRVLKLHENLSENREQAQKELDKLAGMHVEYNAAASIAKAFDRLGLSYNRTAKSGQPSFTKDFLKNSKTPIAQKIMQCREYDKLIGTFVEGSLLNMAVRDRIHCEFNQLKSDDRGTVTGRFSCVHADTMVYTNKGEKPIRSIKIGDKVLSHTGVYRQVQGFFIKGFDNMYDVKLSNGRTITCTAKHLFLTSEGWKDVAWISEQQRNNRKCFENLSLRGKPFNRENSETDWSISENSRNNYSSSHTKRRKSYVVKNKSISSEERRQKPNVWKIWRRTPQLERGMRRRLWLCNNEDRWGSKASAQDSYGKRTRYRDTKPFVSAPYRRKQEKQQYKQPRTLHKKWAHVDSLNPGVSFEEVRITAINAKGSFPVYDICVEVDHSYLSEGVFSHNSKNPNLQQIPSRTDLGNMIRTCFVPDPDMLWVCQDYSQIEIRVLVHYAMGKGAKDVQDTFNRDPKTDYHQWCADVAGISRKDAKTINFGLIYGMGAFKLANSLGITADEAVKFIAEYFGHLPFVKETVDTAMKIAEQRGYVKTLYGRRRRFPLWEAKDGRINKVLKPKTNRTAMERAVTAYGDKNLGRYYPGVQRAFCYRAFNACDQGTSADIMKQAMVDVYESGLCNTIKMYLTVHDELDYGAPKTKEGMEAVREVEHIMKNAVQLKVPLLVDTEIGHNWGEIKKWDQKTHFNLL